MKVFFINYSGYPKTFRFFKNLNAYENHLFAYLVTCEQSIFDWIHLQQSKEQNVEMCLK